MFDGCNRCDQHENCDNFERELINDDQEKLIEDIYKIIEANKKVNDSEISHALFLMATHYESNADYENRRRKLK